MVPGLPALGPRRQGGGIGTFARCICYSLHLPFHVVRWIAYLITMASPLTPAILSLLRLRRTAILTAAALLTWASSQASLSWMVDASNTAHYSPCWR